MEAPANSRGAWELGWAFRVDLNRSKEAFQLHLSFLQVSNSVYNFLDLWLCLPGSFHAQWRGPVWLSVTPWCVACQAPLSMGFSRQEYWSGLHFPLPGDLPDPEIESESLKSCSVMSHSLRPHGLVHGILQARILEWVACPFFRGSEPKSPVLQADSLPAKSQEKPKNTGVGSLSLFQLGLPDPGIEPGFPALQADSLPTELWGKPCVTCVSCKLVGGLSTTEPPGKPSPRVLCQAV